MSIIAYRGSADKPGKVIVDSILTNPESQIERGRQEINKQDSDRKQYTLVRHKLSNIQPGVMVGISDKNKLFVGKVTSFSIQLSFGDSPSSSSQLQVETIL